MKKILVPTDFSDNAENALQYAINLGAQFESEIHLLHIYDVPSRAGMLVSIRDIMKNDAEEQLAELITKMQTSLPGQTKMEGRAIEGYTVKTILTYANKIDADLIVMGTQGATGLKEIFIGSNTVGVINKSKRPVLAIPADYQYQTLKEITFAVDTEVLSTSDVVAPLIKLADKFEAHINLLHIEKTKELAGVDAGIDIYLSDTSRSYHLLNDESINKGIDRFVQNSNTDMLCMIHRDRGFLGNLFHKSITDKEAFDSPVPLLILHDER